MSDPASAPGGRNHLLMHVTLAVLCLFVFVQVRHFEFVGYDDPIYIGKMPETQILDAGLSAKGMRWIWTADAASLWEPLNYLSHMVDIQLWDNEVGDAGGHHFTNLILHVINAGLVLALFYGLGQAESGRGNRRNRNACVAFFSAALFAIHPMRAESVSWISERKGLLCATFVLLSLLAYLRYAQSNNPRWLWGSAIFTAIGMMSKPAGIVVPVLMGLLDIWPLSRCGFGTDRDCGRSVVAVWITVLKRQLREKWLVVFMASALAAVTVYVQLTSNTDKLLGVRPLVARIAHAAFGIVFYLQRTILPTNLTFEYPYPSQSSASAALPISWIAIIVVTVSVFWFRQSRPGLFFGWGWFLICWLPVSGLVYVGTSFTTDRYTYLPHMGLFFGFVHELARRDSHYNEDQKQAAVASRLWRVLSIIGCLIVGLLAILCYRQSSTWQNDLSLNRHAVAAQPMSAVGHLNLGVTLEKSGKPAAAIPHLERSARLAKTYTAFFNLGRAYSQVPNRAAEAAAAYKMAVEINPDYADAWHNLGLSQMRSVSQPSELDPAIESVKKACDLVRGNSPLYLNSLAELLLRQKRYEEAGHVLSVASQLSISNPALKRELQRKMRDLRAAQGSQTDSK